MVGISILIAWYVVARFVPEMDGGDTPTYDGWEKRFEENW